MQPNEVSHSVVELSRSGIRENSPTRPNSYESGYMTMLINHDETNLRDTTRAGCRLSRYSACRAGFSRHSFVNITNNAD